MELGVALPCCCRVGGVELGRGDLAALDQPECVLGSEAQGVDHADTSGP